MPGAELLIPFVLATIAFAALPGPAILYTAARTLAGGKRAGFLTALGLHTGGLFHVATAAAGLAVVFELVPLLYSTLKIAGAVYLVWLGVQMLRGAIKPDDRAEEPQRQVKASFAQSMLVEVLNPKTALFFVAFLPQFVDPAASFPLWLQLLILGQTVNLICAGADLITVWLTGFMLTYAKRSGPAQRIAKAISGTVLIGLGTRLALIKD